MDAVTIDNLSFSYAGGEASALSGITLCLSKGETLALLGADRSGRSTFLYLLAGLMVRFYPGAQTGVCHVWNGCCLSRQPEGVGILLEDPWTQFSGIAFTVFDEVALALEGRVTSGNRETRVGAALEQVGVASPAHRNPFTLSGGEAKRVALASVLMMETPLVLLDEPLSGQDPGGRMAVMRAMDALRERGTSVVAVTHNMDFAAGFDRMVCLDRGCLKAEGLPRTLFADETFALKCPDALALGSRLGLPGVCLTESEVLEGLKKEC